MARIQDRATRGYGKLTAAQKRQAELTTLRKNLEKRSAELDVIGQEFVSAQPEGAQAGLSKIISGEKLTAQEVAAQQTAYAQASSPKPDITDAEVKAGYKIQWVRTGAAGQGEWRKIAPAFIPSLGGSGGAGSMGTSGTGGDATAAPTLTSTETDDYGNVIGIYSDGTTKTLIASGRKYKTTVDLDAYALLEETFKQFGLDDLDLIREIQGYMERGIGSEQAGVELRKSQAYIRRFRGNEVRRSAGLNVVSEAEYLNLENSYNETLRAYGLQGYFGADKKNAQSKMADLIGNDISSIEFKDRIDTVVTRVNNADPTIKGTLRSFYNITDSDLVTYFLNPKENLPKLQEKVTAAEIGSAAIGQGLVTGVTSAEALARLGVTRAQAVEGYGTIAETLPTAQKLSQIYGEEGIQYTQTTAEEEVFKGMASAERKRKQLASREFAAFGGSSGVGRTSLGRGTSGAF